VAITSSGWFGLTLEKFFNATSLPSSGLESETAVKGLLVLDALTPDFNAHNFRDDVEANEVPNGGGYTTGGNTLTSTEVTVASGILTYDAADMSWTSSTISNAMGVVLYFARGGASSADELILLSDFVTAVSTTAGTLSVAWHSSGIGTWDFVP
jgi:hypothetical protein